MALSGGLQGGKFVYRPLNIRDVDTFMVIVGGQTMGKESADIGPWNYAERHKQAQKLCHDYSVRPFRALGSIQNQGSYHRVKAGVVGAIGCIIEATNALLGTCPVESL